MSWSTRIHCDHHDDYGRPDCGRYLTIGSGIPATEVRHQAALLGWRVDDDVNSDYCEQHA
jgi:hypothetical protein